MRVDVSIAYLDDHLIVADKPSGLLSVPGRAAENQDCVVLRLQALYPDALTVHRLDMVTSGLLLHARGKAMQVALSGLFERRQVHKRYIALVQGEMADEAGEIDLRCAATGTTARGRWWNSSLASRHIRAGSCSGTRPATAGCCWSR